jgi:hypothetical protein
MAVQSGNAPMLAVDSNDLASTNGALHHLQALKPALAAIYRSLKPGSYLLANECIGPTRYAHAPRNVALIKG